jgi:hypothetical protein
MQRKCANFNKYKLQNITNENKILKLKFTDLLQCEVKSYNQVLEEKSNLEEVIKNL